ncbi:ABC transporter ATP-binding protein [Actinoplanes sp. NPDC023936]|uniref:ABC transporter ATP-binding protein n=1 Tax=Actinoplanes sp. NPDC023936 TaxID=3154910 RepID=UPI0033E3E7A7
MRKTLVDVARLTKAYGEHRAVDRVSFDVRTGEVVSIVGPSGAGKTTVLRVVAGLLEPTSGSVTIDGVPVTGPPAGIAVVFQDYSRSLLPWLTVLGNVTLPLRAKGLSRADARRTATEALAAVGLGDAARQRPRALSGGMQQRVAIARAIAYRPKLLLMDEPFASVDAQTRMDLEDLVHPLRDRYDMTVVLVTHDIDEAVYLSDRIVVLSPAPATVLRIIDVDLPFPRSQTATKELAAFGGLRREVLDLVRRPADPA